MGNGEHCALLELNAYGALDQGIGSARIDGLEVSSGDIGTFVLGLTVDPHWPWPHPVPAPCCFAESPWPGRATDVGPR